MIPLHGNVETRLRRLDEGAADALVLAAAGIDRLRKQARIDERFEPDVLAPAPGQGALAVQVRRRDTRLMELVSTIDYGDIRLAVEAEREVLRVTGGTCRAPVGALATVVGDEFVLIAGGVLVAPHALPTDLVLVAVALAIWGEAEWHDWVLLSVGAAIAAVVPAPWPAVVGILVVGWLCLRAAGLSASRPGRAPASAG